MLAVVIELRRDVLADFGQSLRELRQCVLLGTEPGHQGFICNAWTLAPQHAEHPETRLFVVPRGLDPVETSGGCRFQVETKTIGNPRLHNFKSDFDHSVSPRCANRISLRGWSEPPAARHSPILPAGWTGSHSSVSADRPKRGEGPTL